MFSYRFVKFFVLIRGSDSLKYSPKSGNGEIAAHIMEHAVGCFCKFSIRIAVADGGKRNPVLEPGNACQVSFPALIHDPENFLLE